VGGGGDRGGLSGIASQSDRGGGKTGEKLSKRGVEGHIEIWKTSLKALSKGGKLKRKGTKKTLPKAIKAERQSRNEEVGSQGQRYRTERRGGKLEVTDNAKLAH